MELYWKLVWGCDLLRQKGRGGWRGGRQGNGNAFTGRASTHVREAVIEFFNARIGELEVFLKCQVTTSLQQIRENC